MLLATLSVFTLVAVACGGDDDDDSSDASTGTAAVSETDAPDGTEAGEPDATEGEAEEASDSNHDVEDSGEPVKGGTLVYGLEADSANGWAGYRTSCATSCFVALSTVTDTLFAVSDEGETVPMLLESVENNADYTEWTLHVREGITFHDGSPLDGEAVKFNIDTCRFAPLTAPAYANITDVTASGQDVVITVGPDPWVALPKYFTTGQCAYMLSQEWLSSLPDVPQRNPESPAFDEALAATPADGNPAEPVGLGAFVFESYTPGNGNSFKSVRNEDYWRGPNGITGEDLPYLDAVEAVVAVDVESRSNSVRSGQFDVMHDANADNIRQFLDDDGFKTVTTDRFGEVGYLMMNVTEGEDIDPQGTNANSPLLTQPCRQALAAAIDQERIRDERGGGLTPPANGPYPPGSVGYLEDTGYPAFDVAAAQEYMEACLAERGTDDIEFTFDTTNDPFNVETNQLIISMWQDAFGDQVKTSITPVEQGQYIGLALTGDFQMFGWRNHGGLDPDQQRAWWQSIAATPMGTPGGNFSRIRDDVIDEALQTIKTNPDEAARKEAAETINKQFGEQVYNLWLTRTVWGIISQPYVNGVERNVLPDGSEGVGLAFAGRHSLNQMWCDDGTCE